MCRQFQISPARHDLFRSSTGAERRTFLWNDQGWGGQKGMLSVVRDGGIAPDDYAPWSPDVMCGKEPAPHVETSEYMEFRPRAGEGYAIWYRVGGGGGHELIIHRIEVHRLRYR